MSSVVFYSYNMSKNFMLALSSFVHSSGSSNDTPVRLTT